MSPGTESWSARTTSRNDPLIRARLESRAIKGITTCRSVDTLSDTATDQIVEWLRSPTLGEKLDQDLILH
jgi:hypothetical protein